MARKTPAPSTALAPLPADPTSDQAAAWLNQVITAKTLDAATRAEVLRVFKDKPELWSAAGNIGRFARHALIEQAAGDQALVKLALEHEVDKLERDLGYAAAAPLERLLIENVVCGWLNFNDVQRRYSRMMAQSISLTLGEYYEKRLSVAQRRYLQAIETLARVRRLAQPMPLQVNIGGQQVNVVGTAPALPALPGATDRPHAR